MAEIITIPDLENGKVDIDTLADIVNLQEPTTETRLSGPVNTWFGVQASLTSATGLAYASKTAMDSAPGTVVGQVARVTEGADKGLYIWSGSAWVETDDPLEFDSLTVNRGRPFPLRSETRAGITSDEPVLFSALLLDISIYGVDDGELIGVRYQKNAAAVAGSYLYGWEFTRHDKSDYATTDAGSQVIHSYTDPAPDIDRDGGIQTIRIIPELRPEMVISITLDADQLPPEGVPIDSRSSNTRPGWSWIVDESRYLFSGPEVDGLTVNKGKIFPFVSRTHGNVPAVSEPSSTVMSWLGSILGARVQNADPLYYYFISGIYSSGNATYPCRWIVQKQLRAGFETQVPDPANNVRIINYTDPMPLYAANTGKQTVALSLPNISEKIYITVDTDSIPSTGQYLATTNTQDGFTFIIDPSQYTYAAASSDSSAWDYQGTKWSYDATTKTGSLVWRSGQELRKMNFAPRGINLIPDITSVSRAPIGNPDTATWVEIRAGGDSATPPISHLAVNNGDGVTDPLYTGGNHGTVNAAGDPTGRNMLFSFLPDGVPVTETSSGVADEIFFVGINRVFAANTISLSRETMEQRGMYKFVNGAFLTHVKWTALEDVRVITDNGPQAITTGFDTAAGTFMYYGKVNSRATFTSVTDSGAKPDFPDVFAVSFKNATNGELIVWMDRGFGVGDGRYVQDVRPLVRGGGTGNTKFYHAAVSTMVADTESRPLILAGESYEWRGGFIMRSTQPSVAGFDTVMVDPEFPESVIAIRDNGLVA